MKIFPKSLKQVKEEHFRKSRGDRSLENKVFLHCCFSFFKDLWKSCTDLVGMNDQHLCVLLMLAIFHESYFHIDEQSWIMRREELSFLLPDTFCLASFDGWVYFCKGLLFSPVPFPKIHLLILKFPCFGISLHSIETVRTFFLFCFVLLLVKMVPLQSVLPMRKGQENNWLYLFFKRCPKLLFFLWGLYDQWQNRWILQHFKSQKY